MFPTELKQIRLRTNQSVHNTKLLLSSVTENLIWTTPVPTSYIKASKTKSDLIFQRNKLLCTCDKHWGALLFPLCWLCTLWTATWLTTQQLARTRERNSQLVYFAVQEHFVRQTTFWLVVNVYEAIRIVFRVALIKVQKFQLAVSLFQQEKE